MEFVEAVNPHYAFPIVGVIVCALLVFAFGFKSPGQPPSFDNIVDEERKVPKKRKGKENQKSKLQQNGKVAGNVAVKVDSTIPAAKVKGNTEKSSTKAEAKSNKKSRTQQNSKSAESGNKKEVRTLEDNSEAGWVQLLSKKERKNRKKDDITAADLDVVKPSVAKTSDVRAANNSTEKGNQSKTTQKEVKAIDVNDDVEKQVDDDDLKPTSKVQRTPKKKKAKKEESEQSSEVNVTKQILRPKTPDALKETAVAQEIKMYAPLIESNPVAEPAGKELLQIQENMDVEEEAKNKTKKKKGKKKNQENPAQENNVSDTVCVETPVVEKGNKTVESEALTKKETIIETKHISQDVNGKVNGNEHKEIVPTKGSSNVAFDELGDLSEEKPQKKKKKARREH